MNNQAPIRCVVVDDEPLALKLLADYVQKTPFFTLVEQTTDPLNAMQVVQQGGADLLFLDIQMPELTGLQLLKIIGHKCKVIITTAYPDYALEGYEFDVVDYLLKPVTFDRFLVAAHKAKERLMASMQTGTQAGNYSSGNHQTGNEPSLNLLPDQTIHSQASNNHTATPVPPGSSLQPVSNSSIPGFIFVKTEYKIQKIDLADILYLEGLRDYVAIHTTQGKILTLQSIRSFQEQLPESNFIRVHKSYLIALDKIQFIERNRIVIREQYIPIGETYQEQFQLKLNIKNG